MPSNISISGRMPASLGMVFIFNLMVGNGAQTLPSAFAHCGWLISSIIISIISLTSYVTATFIIESMSIASALVALRKRRLSSVSQPSSDIYQMNHDEASERQPGPANTLDETDPLISRNSDDLSNESTIYRKNNDTDIITRQIFNVDQVIEFGELARMFFDDRGTRFFYFSLCTYLYGDLTIYSVAISKSVTYLLCERNATSSSLYHVTQSDLCWPSSSTPDSENITRLAVYRISILAVLLGCGSLSFFNVQKTKYLQIFTSFYRWFAFVTMITLAIIAIASGKAEGIPIASNFAGIPNLFGVSIYSFMCHHSIPSLIAPIGNKSNIYKFILVDYVLILVFYLLLSITAVFCFKVLEDLYTLNFLSSPIPRLSIITPILLPMFPIFVLGTNFPIVAITLSNNLRALFNTTETPESWINKYAVPLGALLPPVALSLFLSDLGVLIGVVGSYSGLFIQCLIPALLVIYARKQLPTRDQNPLASPFASNYWTHSVIFWTFLCLLIISVDIVLDKLFGIKF